MIIPQPPFADLTAAAAWFDSWLRQAALPLWSSVGVDGRNGAFEEAITLGGAPHAAPRRARVQARQVFVFATAAAHGLGPRYLEVARRGFAHFDAHYRQPSSLFAFAADAEGVTDPAAPLYEQAFALLAMASLGDVPDPAAQRQALAAYRHDAGGFREIGPHPFQANAHMHLLEAALAWEDRRVDPAWTAMADEIVVLALARFIDAKSGLLREFFDADWRPLTGEAALVEPGHQFEWAWLLERWGVRRADASARAAARRLFAHGRRGFDPQRGVVVDALWDDLSTRSAAARLWPQTEYMKAALILAEDVDALAACNALALYLATPTPGVWRDTLNADGAFIDQPAPASSFYHILVALLALLETGAVPASQ